jgi:hypothetical protein
MNRKPLITLFFLVNILGIIISFLYGVSNDEGGAGFGYIIIGLAGTGIISVILFLLNLILLKG